jgi:hypothetical protein
VVLFPPVINRNFKGEVTQLPFTLNQVIISEELLDMCEGDYIEALRLGVIAALKDNRFGEMDLFQINEVEPVKPIEFVDDFDGGIINIHFQIPAYCILPDSMVPDETPVSYYMSARYLFADQNEEPLRN